MSKTGICAPRQPKTEAFLRSSSNCKWLEIPFQIEFIPKALGGTWVLKAPEWVKVGDPVFMYLFVTDLLFFGRFNTPSTLTLSPTSNNVSEKFRKIYVIKSIS